MTGVRRILHVLPDLSRGGGQVVVLELVARCDRTRFDPFVCALGGPSELADAFGSAGGTVVSLHGGGVSQLAALVRTIGRLDIDLVHVHSDSDRKIGQLAALLKRVPVIGHLHSPWAHLEPMYEPGDPWFVRWSSRAKARLRSEVERRAVAHYIAVGGEVARFHSGRLTAPITVVNNGIDTERFVPGLPADQLAARSSLGIPADVPVVAFVGRLAPGKGQDTLLEVMQGLSQAHLLLIGDGDQFGSLADRAVQLGVSDRVLFAGNRTDVERLLITADAFAMASVSEGLPLSVLEAMACGLPVVAYDLPGLKDVITDGEDGRLVPFGDRSALEVALGELLDNGSERREMAAAARKTATSRFDSRLMATEVEAVYDLVLGGSDRDVHRSGDVCRSA